MGERGRTKGAASTGSKSDKTAGSRPSSTLTTRSGPSSKLVLPAQAHNMEGRVHTEDTETDASSSAPFPVELERLTVADLKV